MKSFSPRYLFVAASVLALSACSTQVGSQAIKIGGQDYVLLTYEKGTSSGMKTTYAIAEQGDLKDPIADCDTLADCIKQVERRQAADAAHDPVPESLRRPPRTDPLDPTPELSSDDLPVPLQETSFGD